MISCQIITPIIAFCVTIINFIREPSLAMILYCVSCYHLCLIIHWITLSIIVDWEIGKVIYNARTMIPGESVYGQEKKEITFFAEACNEALLPILMIPYCIILL